MVFLESMAFQLRYRMLSLFPAQFLKRYGHFSRLEVEIALSHRHVEKRRFFWGKTNKAIHGLNEDVTATA